MAGIPRRAFCVGVTFLGGCARLAGRASVVAGPPAKVEILTLRETAG